MQKKLDEAEQELAQLKSETETTGKQLREELQEAKVAALSARSAAASLKVGTFALDPAFCHCQATCLGRWTDCG